MVRLHHRLNGHEFEQTLGDSGGQRIRHNLATEQQQQKKFSLSLFDDENKAINTSHLFLDGNRSASSALLSKD